jgi:Domain of unknown function (DUF4148)
MSFRPSTLKFALSFAFAAAALSPLAAQAQSDGFELLGDTLIYVGHQQPSTKTRAEVLAEAREFNRRAVLPDGWRHLNDGIEFVGTPSTKTRAEVRAELIQWQKNPISHDGWLETGSGHLVYKGVPMPKADMTVAVTK